MRNTWAVCKREFAGYFVTPVGYVVVGTFAAISGFSFAYFFTEYCTWTLAPGKYLFKGAPDFEETFLSQYLVFCGLLIMFIGPLITMRLFAGERSRGTMELLLTYPLRDGDIVFGKFLASCGMLLVMMGVLGVHMAILAWITDVEPAVLWFGLLTVLLMGMAFVSLGLFVSAMANNPVTAGTMTFGLWFVMYILGSFGRDLPEENPAPETFSAGLRTVVGFFYAVFRRFVQELPIDTHARDMAQGVVQPKDLAYYVLFIAFFLFLTFRALESRRWRA
ncbi:MAG TPA: ABC transporter permease subunit [Candidatus Hydrogenedentes bacterium]|nr:ABC transporter permease subunit [Candidatus Hydrogenedentota bacterium]